MKSNNLAYIKRREMELQAQVQGANQYHYQHIRQFCEYADAVAAGVKEEIMRQLPQMIQKELQKPKVKVEVDEASLKRVKEKVEGMLSSLFGRR